MIDTIRWRCRLIFLNRTNSMSAPSWPTIGQKSIRSISIQSLKSHDVKDFVAENDPFSTGSPLQS
jgi:hypothetical protein